MILRELIRQGENILSEAGVHDSANDARELLAYVTGFDRTGLIMYINSEITEEKASRYLELIEKRAAHVPLQHITGEQEFMGYRFIVNKDVLVPRMDTELLVEEAVKRAGLGAKILDLCTGSGIIGIALKKLCFGSDVTLTDISDKALEIAEINAKENKADVKIVKSDMFKGLDPDEKYSMIVSNPPYIQRSEIADLAPEVKDHDPISALDGGEDGLDFYRIIADQAPGYMKQGAWLLMEIGYDQGQAVPELLRATGKFEEDIEVLKDLGGNDRVVVSRLK